MILLAIEKLKSHEDAKLCYICRKKIFKKLSKSKNYQKIRDHCHYTGKYRGAAHSIYNLKFNGICNLKFNVPHEIRVVFRNGSNYDYLFCH